MASKSLPLRAKGAILLHGAEVARTFARGQKGVRVTLTRESQQETSPGPKPRALSPCRCQNS